MAFDQDDRGRNENKKFAEDDSGNTAVRVKLVDGVRLSEGASFKIYDFRGFLVFEITDQGTFKHKGEQIKI